MSCHRGANNPKRSTSAEVNEHENRKMPLRKILKHARTHADSINNHPPNPWHRVERVIETETCARRTVGEPPNISRDAIFGHSRTQSHTPPPIGTFESRGFTTIDGWRSLAGGGWGERTHFSTMQISAARNTIERGNPVKVGHLQQIACDDGRGMHFSFRVSVRVGWCTFVYIFSLLLLFVRGGVISGGSKPRLSSRFSTDGIVLSQFSCRIARIIGSAEGRGGVFSPSSAAFCVMTKPKAKVGDFFVWDVLLILLASFQRMFGVSLRLFSIRT